MCSFLFGFFCIVVLAFDQPLLLLADLDAANASKYAHDIDLQFMMTINILPRSRLSFQRPSSTLYPPALLYILGISLQCGPPSRPALAT